jgi:RNA polymerase sigma factor (sigma-70 family)
MAGSPALAVAAEQLEPHRRRLWALCYRMTGVAADADELVQETFLRVLSAPPADRARDLLPWLVRVAMNASRDVLRRRRRDVYVGPWLPSPLDIAQLEHAPSPAARYDQRESASYAFLRALEALSTSQRAIVVLRDVLDYSVKETAELLALSEANVKTSHHRARERLERYEADRPHAASLEVARAAMVRFFAHVALDDVAGLESLLSGAVEGLNDGAGEFFAARVPLYTPARVARFYLHTAQKSPVVRVVPCELSGLPAVIAEVVPYAPGVPARSVNLFEAAPDGRILRIYSLVATRKIAHLTG